MEAARRARPEAEAVVCVARSPDAAEAAPATGRL